MEFLKNIDWHNHDGVNLGMINDFVRNQFYDKVISQHVAGQYCTDIGFGTGLLSMIALKHGAKHIRAFESDVDRYQLGSEIIHQLGLGNRIELINERYDRTYQPTAVTFTETVNGNLWWEGLWNSLPENNNTLFLPGEYFLEIWAVDVPEKFAQGLCRPGRSQARFNPGIDLDPTFVDLVNKFSNKQSINEIKLPSGIVRFERQQHTDWGWVPYLKAVQAGSVVAQYIAKRWQANIEYFELEVDTSAWKNKHVLVVPRMGMKQDKNVLYLDVGHWGPGEDPILLVKPQQNLVVRHSVRNGLITYSPKE